MGKGAKVLLGCGIAAVVVGGGIMIVFVGGLFWVKGKAQNYASAVTAKTEEISRYEKQANQNTFTPPADGVLQEGQLVKFLTVRKEIYSVYQQHKPEFDSLAERTKDKKDLSFSETVEAGSLLARLAGDVRLVQMKALAAAGMSEGEYRYIQQAVYMSAWAGEFEKEAGQQPSEHVQQGIAMEKQALEAGKGALGDEVKGAQDVLDQLGQRAKAIEVPRTNIDLFRKHEADIKKYAMTGLAAFGL